MSFNPNVPTGLVNLDVDYANVQNNFSSSNTSFGVNHVPFSVALNNGKHKFVEMPNGILPVGLAAGESTLYSKSVSGASQLFFTRDNSGIEIQLTGPTTPVANTNGYTFLPGGILMQWGIVNSPTSTGTVTFATANIAFPTSCFNVQCTLIAKSGGTSTSNTVAPITGTVTNTGFGYSYTATSSYVAFYWVALGK